MDRRRSKAATMPTPSRDGYSTASASRKSAAAGTSLVRVAGDLVDGQAPTPLLDPAQRGPADVQPAGEGALRQRLAVERVRPVRADHASKVSAVERGGHRLGLPELGRHVGRAVAPAQALHRPAALSRASRVPQQQ
jgi:hypothetical protein